MLMWSIIFMTTLIIAFTWDTHATYVSARSRIKREGCALASLKRDVKDHLTIALVEESLLRLAPIALIYYGVVNQLVGLSILLITNASYIVYMVYPDPGKNRTFQALYAFVESLRATLMILLWLALTHMAGLWLAYTAAILLRVSLAVYTYFIECDYAKLFHAIQVFSCNEKHIN